MSEEVFGAEYLKSNVDEVLELFKDRLKEDGAKVKVKQADPLNNVMGGYSPEKKEAILPTFEDAVGRTIRLHESLHALYSGEASVDQSFLSQAVEDAYLHVKCAQTRGSVRRDELTMAYLDLRSIRYMPLGMKDAAFLVALRARAMMQGGDVPHPELADKLFQKCTDLGHFYDPDMPLFGNGQLARDAIDSALDYLKKDNKAAARRIIEKFFTGAKMQSPRELMKMTTRGWGRGGGKKREEEKSNFLSLGDATDYLSGGSIKDIMSKPDGYPRMKIEHMAQKATSEATFKGPSEKLVMAGMKIRAKKLALAISPAPPRMFLRRAKHLNGGTVLIDASGSMSIPDGQLQAVAEKIPLGTVAYYSGQNGKAVKDSKGDPCIQYNGTLAIYSEKGRRYKHQGGGKLPFRYGENYIDFPALQWLLKQPAPRYFVTDTGWTGDDSFRKATDELFKGALKNKQFIHCHDLDMLCAKLGIGVL